MSDAFSTQGRGGIALLIDADNLSSPDAVEEALRKLTELCGPVAIRRAYGSADNLKGLATVMRDLAIRPIVHDPLGKNTTDMLLAVDALDLWHQCAPAVMAIGTGDADFAPLALRLRERGVRLICFAQQNKLSPDIRAYYDQVFTLRPKSGAQPVAAPAAPAPAAAVAVKTAAKAKPKAARPPVGALVTPVASVPPAASLPRSSPPLPDVPAILGAVPGLQAGQAVAIRDAGRLLHDAELLGKKASSVRLFKKHPTQFELTPGAKPSHVRYLGADVKV